MRCYGSFLSVLAVVVGLSTTVGGCALRSEGPPESRRLTAESADGRPRWIIRRREVQRTPDWRGCRGDYGGIVFPEHGLPIPRVRRNPRRVGQQCLLLRLARTEPVTEFGGVSDAHDSGFEEVRGQLSEAPQDVEPGKGRLGSPRTAYRAPCANHTCQRTRKLLWNAPPF